MLALVFAALLAAAPGPGAFTLRSTDVQEGQPLAAAQVFDGMGCTGGNLSPQLSWENPPEGTKSFAVTVYDPDAPTGSGWWHWILFDVPAATTSLPGGLGVRSPLPDGFREGRNDAGSRHFGGACPPPGSEPHHYVFTVHALKVDKLPVAEDASAAMIGFMLHMNRLGTATLTATYAR